MSEGAHDYRHLDEVIHGRVRLAIMAFLSGTDQSDFSRLKKITGTTDGNLSTNLRKLEEAGYIQITKTFVDRRPQTTCGLTQKGRDAWLSYLDSIGDMLGMVKG